MQQCSQTKARKGFTFTDALSVFRTAISYRFVAWLQENHDVFALHNRQFRAGLGLNFVQVPLED